MGSSLRAIWRRWYFHTSALMVRRGEGLAADRFHLAFPVHAGIGHGGYDEAHLCTFLPKGAGKFMRENQGIKAAFGGEEFDRLLGSGPLQRNVGLIPAAKFKAVGHSLTDEHEQSL